MKNSTLLLLSLSTLVLFSGCFGPSTSVKGYEKDNAGYTKGDLDHRENDRKCTRMRKDTLGFTSAG